MLTKIKNVFRKKSKTPEIIWETRPGKDGKSTEHVLRIDGALLGHVYEMHRTEYREAYCHVCAFPLDSTAMRSKVCEDLNTSKQFAEDIVKGLI